MYQLEIKERAAKMMREAYEWYEEQQTSLGEAFLNELDTIYQKLINHPQFFSIIAQKYRQVKLLRFPYVVVYEIMEEKVVVFAIFHTARNPQKKYRKPK